MNDVGHLVLGGAEIIQSQTASLASCLCIEDKLNIINIRSKSDLYVEVFER